jgi:poly-gamma-glutamate capsule biosynthesis protein CapA/YwtB (metallophosphatase superfamily)
MILQSPLPTQTCDRVTILCTGDVILDVPAPEHWLAGIAPAFAGADVVVGHLEVPHTSSTEEHGSDVPAPGADPAALAALRAAGFHVMTLAGNHVADCGAAGIKDTITGLQALGIAHCGAGPDLVSARRPALVDAKGRRVAVLSYNCVGPESAWAGVQRAGCAFLPVSTADGGPVAPTSVLTEPGAEAGPMLREDIAAARAEAGLVIVALHKGIVHTPAIIAPYERRLSHAAIDAGADVVVGHHAHIVRGIEFYKGKPVFHGLGNGCVVTHALNPDQAHPARAAWAQRRKQLFGFEPDPAYTLAPFHPEAVNAFIARVVWHGDGTLEFGIEPVHVDPPGRPRLARAEERTRICNYIADITRAAGLPALSLQALDGRISV